MEYSFYIPLTCPTGILSRKGRGQTARPSLLPVRRARRARGEVKQLENDTFIKRRVGTRPTNSLSCRKVFVRHLCKTTRSPTTTLGDDSRWKSGNDIYCRVITRPINKTPAVGRGLLSNQRLIIIVVVIIFVFFVFFGRREAVFFITHIGRAVTATHGSRGFYTAKICT